MISDWDRTEREEKIKRYRSTKTLRVTHMEKPEKIKCGCHQALLNTSMGRIIEVMCLNNSVIEAADTCGEWMVSEHGGELSGANKSQRLRAWQGDESGVFRYCQQVLEVHDLGCT